jgi:hypothetical protein
MQLASNLQTSKAMMMMRLDVKMRSIDQATERRRLEELKKVRMKMEMKTKETVG